MSPSRLLLRELQLRFSAIVVLALLFASISQPALAQETPKRLVYVLGAKVKVLAGETPIGEVTTGERYYLVSSNGRHSLIWLDDDGQKQGWVPVDQVLVEPPLSTEQWRRVNAARDQRNAGWDLQKQGKTKECVAAMQAALRVMQELLGAAHPEVGSTFAEIGEVHREARDPVAAAEVYKQAITITEKAFGGNHPRSIRFRDNLAHIYDDAGRFELAEPLVRRNLEADEAVHGKNHPLTGAAAGELAVVVSRLGRIAEADALYERNLKIYESQPIPVQDGIAVLLLSMGEHYTKLGRLAEAETSYRRCVEIREAKYGKNSAEVVPALTSLAATYQRRQKLGEAELLQRRALAVSEATLGKDHPQTSVCLNNLAVTYQHLGRNEDAEPLYKRLVAIQESTLGKDHPTTAVSLNNLATLLATLGKLKEAETLQKRVLKIRQATLGDDHVDIATSLLDQGNLMRTQGRPLEEIEPLFKRAIAIRTAKLGANHPETGKSLHDLGSLYSVMGRLRDAQDNLNRSAEICAATLGKDDPETARAWNDLGRLYAMNERPDYARTVYDHGRRSARNYVTALLPTLNSQQQASYLLTNYASAFNQALSLGFAHGAGDPRLAEASAAWLANGKGVQHEAQALTAQLQSLDSPEAKPIADELRKTRQAYSALRAQPAQAGREEARSRGLAELESRERELGNQLQKIGGRTGKGKGWTEFAAIRSGMPTGGVLIDFVKLDVTDFNTQATEHTHYAAWITPKVGPVRIVDFGREADLHDLLIGFHNELTAAAPLIQQKGELEAENDLRAKSQALCRKLLDPLLKIAEVRDAKHWVVSPDGELWLIPWCALPLADGKYLVEKHTVRLVNAGRDAAFEAVATNPKTTPPLIVADPDFDLGRAKAAQVTKQITGDENAADPQRGSISRELSLGKIARLPASATEAALIADPIGALAKVAPRVFSGDKALESVVKATHRPRLLSFSTHGFYLQEQAIRDDAEGTRSVPRGGSERPGGASIVTKDGKSYESPLLRCGLLLAACNDQPPPGQTRPGEDGVLTGLEVVALDLRGCELVVLSACETGLGQIQSGEGVAGLRQAFQLAGADSVLASLWSVPDRETALLMVNYFRELAGGKDRPSSLAAAQRTLIEKRREKRGAAHPFFWAAFCLTGRDLATSGELPSAELYTERGRRRWDADSDLALADFDAALALDPKAARAMHNRGIILKERDKLDEAMAAYDKSIAMDGKIAAFYRNRADLHQQRNDNAKALADLDRAVKLDDTVDSLLDRAYFHRVTPNPNAAKADLTEALRRFPNSGRAWTEKGIQAQEAKRTDEALAAFTKAVELEPQRFSALFNRGKLYLAKEENEKAEADLTAATEVDPNHRDARIELAQVRNTLGDDAGAEVEWKKLAEQNPKWGRPRWEIGARLYLAGQSAEAAEHIEAFIALEPEFDAYGVRSGIRLDKGDLEGAEADAVKSIDMSGHAFAYLQLGLVKVAQKQPPAALKALNKSLELNPKFIPAYKARIQAHRLAGNEAAARADEAKLKELEAPGK